VRKYRTAESIHLIQSSILSMFVASKRDMVLLSIDSQLPSTDGRLRLLSTSTSIQDARIPLKKGYARFHLEIGGFLVEDLGNPDGARGSSNAGVRVTQLSDLGEMASWVPSSIIRMVASTMVPRSINTITKVAAKMKVPSALTQQGNGYAGQGEDGRELERLSDVGGTWHPGRHLPPIWSRSEVAPRKLSFNNSTEADSSSSTLVVPSEKEESAIESGQDHDAISSETKPLQMPPTSPLDHIGEGDPVNARLSTESIASPSTNLNSRVNIRAVSGRTDSAASFNSGVTLVDEDTVAATAEEGQPNRSEGRDRLNDDDEEVASAEESSAAQYSHILSGHAKTFSRRSPAQKTAQRRLSTMLMNGSEAIAIMIAPAARDSMISVAHIMEASINGNLSNALILEEDALEGGYVNILSKSAPRPLMTLPRGAGATIKASMISVNAYPSSSSQISISNGNNRHQLDPSSSSTASWTTAIAVAPYTLAISILNFAVWSTSAAVEKGGEDVGSDAEDVRSTALSQTRKAYLQRDMFKEKVEERPRSYYRTDDTKLYPFPLLISDTLPPLGIAASSGVLMDCEPARLPAHDVTPKQASWWGSYW
jgi:hypothetical protein